MAQWWKHSPRTRHQCDPGSIPGNAVICRLSLLLVLVLFPRGFSPDSPVVSSETNVFKFQHFNIQISFLTAGCLAFLAFRLFRAASTPIIYCMYIFIFCCNNHGVE